MIASDLQQRIPRGIAADVARTARNLLSVRVWWNVVQDFLENVHNELSAGNKVSICLIMRSSTYLNSMNIHEAKAAGLTS